MFLKNSPSTILSAALLSAVAQFASAEAVIDRELQSGVDFRSLDYSVCVDQTECLVNGIKIKAQRRDREEDAAIANAAVEPIWNEAKIYWDPIDGLGIKDGAQNDEIDFDERLLVTFDTQRSLRKVWFSDLFKSEDKRYGSSGTDRVEGQPKDAEIAGIGLNLGDIQVATLTVAGESNLPWATFNQEVSIRFQENGDLRRRVVINEEIVTIVVPGKSGSGRNVSVQLPLGQIDKDKRGIFEGVETVEIDLTDILAEFQDAPLFPVGTTNFEIIKSLVEDPESLANLKKAAMRKRDTLRMSNGEVGWEFEAAETVDGLTFFAPFDASNDFSIAGLIFEEKE